MYRIEELKLIKLLNISGTKLVDEYLRNNSSNLAYFMPHNLETFYKAYLSFNFDIKKKEPFAIFDYIKNAPHVNIYDILIESNYFKTMPNEYILCALSMYYSCDILLKDKEFYSTSFADYLIMRVEDSDIFKSNLPFNMCNSEVLIKKIMSFKNIDLLFLDNVKNNINIKKYEIYFKEYYSLEDLKKYYLNKEYNFSNLFVTFDYFLDNINMGIDFLLEVLEIKLRKSNLDNDFIYNEFFISLKSCDNLKEENIEYLAKSVSKSNNAKLMYYYLMNFDSKVNSEIIDNLLNIDIEYISNLLLYGTSDNMRLYINKLSSKGKNYFKNIISILIKKCNINLTSVNYDLARIDEVLENIFKFYPDVNISKGDRIKLLAIPTKFFNKLLSIDDYTLKDREFIVKFLSNNGYFDLLSLYGAYLITGDKDKLPDYDYLNEDNLLDISILRKNNLDNRLKM